MFKIKVDCTLVLKLDFDKAGNAPEDFLLFIFSNMVYL